MKNSTKAQEPFPCDFRKINKQEGRLPKASRCIGAAHCRLVLEETGMAKMKPLVRERAQWARVLAV